MIGVAAVVVASLAHVDARLLEQLHSLRAAEAAAEAAGAIVADRFAELHDEAVERHEAELDPIDAVLSDATVERRATEAARDVLVGSGASLLGLTLARRADELSVRADVRAGGAERSARVGVRPR